MSKAGRVGWAGAASNGTHGPFMAGR